MVSSSVAINYSNLFTQSHANVYNMINNRSNVPDPISSSGARKFVRVREPKSFGRDFSGWPTIIIPNTGITQKNASVSATIAEVIYEITINVWTQDKTSDSLGDPLGASQLDTISDNILKTLNTEANRKTLRNNGMSNFEIIDSPSDWEEVDGKFIFNREFTINFRNRTKVIA